MQVTETMLGEETRKRELAPLFEIQDNYEKVILSMDKDFITSYEGIKVKNIIDFLLEDNHNTISERPRHNTDVPTHVHDELLNGLGLQWKRKP